jgi:radical SAM protein with 4Fe4S-binding SPASM domain
MNGKQLNLNDMDLLIRTYQKYNQKVVGLFGGEPFLHPDIFDIIERLNHSELRPVVYSNALMREDVLNELVKTDIRMVLNLNTKEVYSEEKYELLLQNLDILSQKLGRKVRLGINFYKTQQDIESIFDILKKTKFDHHIRIGLASPILDETNTYAVEEDIATIGNEIYEFIKYSLSLGYIPFFDCGIRLCMFEDQQLEDIRYDVAGPISHSACYRMFTLYPDLTISPCITLAENTQKFSLDEKTDFKKIYNFYDKAYSKYALKGNLENCNNCQMFLKECTGGCLARTILNDRKSDSQLKDAQ